MNFSLIDAQLTKWAAEHALSVTNTFKDEEVRSIESTDIRGRRFQMWIDSMDSKSIIVKAWDFKHRRAEFSVPPTSIEDALDAALATIQCWKR